MKFRYLHIICLMMAVLACSKTESDPEPVVQPGDALSIGVTTRSGEPELPAGNYGLFGIEYAYNATPPSWNPSPSTFYHTNKSAALNATDKKLDFGNNCRYPINDYLSVFLYYPHNIAVTTPNIIPVGRTVTTDSNGNAADKYPDYLGGKQYISVVGGAPNSSSETTVEMSHLMSRVRFQTKNAGAAEIELLSVKLVGIRWSGAINPLMTINPLIIGTVNGYFTPGTGVTPETVTLITNFEIPANLSGSTTPRPIQVDPKYNYSDKEAIEVYDEDNKYYILVPPLDETALQSVKLEVEFSKYGAPHSAVIDMKHISVQQWLPGHSYSYTLTFSTYTIDYIDIQIEPWLKELYAGSVM